MDGRRYYSFKPSTKQSVRFFALESSYLNPEQIAWFEKELKDSDSDWKIPYFHHPPYSSGERHGSDTQMRQPLEPLFLKYNVSVVLTGHDHFYERTKPQKGIVYFVCGSGGQLRKGNIDKSTGLTAAGNDQDQAFMTLANRSIWAGSSDSAFPTSRAALRPRYVMTLAVMAMRGPIGTCPGPSVTTRLPYLAYRC